MGGPRPAPALAPPPAAPPGTDCSGQDRARAARRLRPDSSPVSVPEPAPRKPVSPFPLRRRRGPHPIRFFLPGFFRAPMTLAILQAALFWLCPRRSPATSQPQQTSPGLPGPGSARDPPPRTPQTLRLPHPPRQLFSLPHPLKCPCDFTDFYRAGFPVTSVLTLPCLG